MSFTGTQQKCKACEKTVYPVEQLSADGVSYHKSCFKCSHCKGTLKVLLCVLRAGFWSLTLLMRLQTKGLGYICSFICISYALMHVNNWELNSTASVETQQLLCICSFEVFHLMMSITSKHKLDQGFQSIVRIWCMVFNCEIPHRLVRRTNIL